ncbi:site-specific integrase [Streptomyces lydicus]|uniref:site-specific integrase n=1 Tax=Streptomyces lydicus TaxID=47763 RepID=UPI0010102131|nr:site-specific integrase [Streptomyces lydicus]MCZ1012295.1 site-specific integrase [Streptomyces lydicus]
MTTTAPLTTRTDPLAITDMAGEAQAALLERFPPREPAASWPATTQSCDEILSRISVPPRGRDGYHKWGARRRGTAAILTWLENFPGSTWQERWQASPAQDLDPDEWKSTGKSWTDRHGRPVPSAERADLASGMLLLLARDVIRPELPWLARMRPSVHLRKAVIENRDPDGFAKLAALLGEEVWASTTSATAQNQIIRIMIAKGGRLADLTVGDCLELRLIEHKVRHKGAVHTHFYSWLRQLGIFPGDAPVSLRLRNLRPGQLTPEQLVDRFRLRCQPVRDLIVDYLKERQPSVDYSTLQNLSRALAHNFWADLERHHPGIDSIALPPDVAAGWKERFRTITSHKRQPDGTVIETTKPRISYISTLMLIRAFYLDIAQWAAEDPARWGLWAVRCPISSEETRTVKHEKQQQSRSRRRTRERLPVLPTLVDFVATRLREARMRLDALQQAKPGAEFTVLDETFIKPKTSAARVAQLTRVAWDSQGRRRNLTQDEHRAFWAWAAVEFLRHTGVRIEEMLETSHHSITQYKLPSTGEVVPLLQIAPSKTDEERALLVTPELADVLSAIVWRVRDRTGALPLVSSFDDRERIWNPPLPLLFQWESAGRRWPVSPANIRKALNEALAAIGLIDENGKPLRFQPHDFRRIFVTDAIANGMPPHIAQIICGHKDINTTMGYNSVYPNDAFEAHRAFIARRRAMRPAEEYRTPTSEEWDQFLGHFEKRKLSVGICGRAFATQCIHEHACIRCSLLRPEPAQRHRLIEIRDNLVARIIEAEQEGWLGEIEGLQISLTGAEGKIAQLDAQEARRNMTVDLGIPAFPDSDQ